MSAQLPAQASVMISIVMPVMSSTWTPSTLSPGRSRFSLVNESQDRSSRRATHVLRTLLQESRADEVLALVGKLVARNAELEKVERLERRGAPPAPAQRKTQQSEREQ